MTNENVIFDKSSVCAQLFRCAVKEVLPISVQGKLRDIPGLDEMDHDQPGKGMLVLTRAHIAKKTECIQIQGQEEIIKKQQKQAGEQEKLEWKLRGANEVGEIWRTPQGQVVVAEQLEQMVLSQAHGVGHNNRTEMIDTIIKQNNMWFHRMQEKVNEFLTRCSECITRNIK